MRGRHRTGTLLATGAAPGLRPASRGRPRPPHRCVAPTGRVSHEVVEFGFDVFGVALMTETAIV